MPTEDFDAPSKAVAAKAIDPSEETNGAAKSAHPAPPMLWMLLPVALLALLAFLSR
jgi:hypothetical protein